MEVLRNFIEAPAQTAINTSCTETAPQMDFSQFNDQRALYYMSTRDLWNGKFEAESCVGDAVQGTCGAGRRHESWRTQEQGR